MDVRSVTHDTVPDNAQLLSTDPRNTSSKTSVKISTKVVERDYNQSHCTANPASDSEVQF